MNSKSFEEIAEKMIAISKTKPLLPETFVPWQDEPDENTRFMPDNLASLYGHPLWETLTLDQQIELGRLEIVQVMYSYAWSETLACLIFNRRLLELSTDSVEYRFLIREAIEEYRHQEMFGMAIQKLNRKPILPNFAHRLFGNITSRYLPSSMAFMSVLTIELMADIYAKHIRKDTRVYSVLRKSSELHHIEEGRHIHYTKAWLERYTENANIFTRTSYSFIVMFSVYFMRTLYVKKEFFEQLKVNNPTTYYKAALSNYNNKFADLALEEIIELVNEFKGFNWVTRPFWKLFLKIKF